MIYYFLFRKELLAFYTMAQISFIQFLVVIVGMSVCMAWRVAEDELLIREEAVQWLKREDPQAFAMRDEIIQLYGEPGSSIRPEGNASWVSFGIVAAFSFTLLGWHNWSNLPPSSTATLLIVLNLLTILTSTLILHLGFFGRLLSLYKRNFQRVEFLSQKLKNLPLQEVNAWWNCRNFVLNEDLALDYDIGGLAMSLTFVIAISVFTTALIQCFREGLLAAIMEPPGSYCAYACLYVTLCLLKIFSLATGTFEEQYRHLTKLERITMDLMSKSGAFGSFANLDPQANAIDDFGHLSWDDGVGLDMDGDENDALSVSLNINGLGATNDASFMPIQHLKSFSHDNNSPRSAVSHDVFQENEITDSNVEKNRTPQTEYSIANRQSAFKFSSLASSFSFSRFGVVNSESARQAIADMISQIRCVCLKFTNFVILMFLCRKYDPYPCILGIPVMPALFNTCKFYIFIFFLLIGFRVFGAVCRKLL